jgi:hypothetical protein
LNTCGTHTHRHAHTHTHTQHTDTHTQSVCFKKHLPTSPHTGTGSEQWVQTLGSTGMDAVYGITLDTSGDVYVAGSTTLVVQGSQPDVFVAKLLGWVRQ